MQALFFLAFVLALREASRNPEWRRLPLRFVPAALLAVGSVYTYSFPGLIWLGGPQPSGAWRSTSSADSVPRRVARRAPQPPAPVCGVPPVRRPDRPRDRPHDRLPQLRDLRPQRPGPRQPLRPDLALRGARHLALGRLPPQPRRRCGAGVRLLPRRRLRRDPARLRAGPLLAPPRDGADRRARRRGRSPMPRRAIGGTPYTAAKAIEIAAPMAALVIVLPLLRRPVAWLYLQSRRAARCWRSPTRRSARPPTRRP